MNPVDFIHRIATGEARTRWLLTPLGPIFFLAFMTTCVAGSLWLDRFLRLPKIPSSGLMSFFSLLLLLIGLGLMIWSLVYFALARGTPVPFNPPPKLVVTGPYSFVRNPMYLGAFIAILGLGLWLRSLAVAFFLTLLVVLLINWAVKAIEEPELEKRLGAEYKQYKKRMPRFFPHLR